MASFLTAQFAFNVIIICHLQKFVLVQRHRHHILVSEQNAQGHLMSFFLSYDNTCLVSQNTVAPIDEDERRGDTY